MAESEKKLFLLDAFALIYRAYYGFINNPRINSKGFNTSAILGFTNTLIEVIRKEKPSHIAVAFDTPGPTERDVMYKDYKANREAMPEDIALAIPYIKEVIEGFNIPILECPGYEADDIIGTLAKKAEINGFQTYMMTPDKDFGQLISENIFMYKPPRGGNEAEVIGVKEICNKYNIEKPEQLIDILGLWGDKVDNIPGVPGIGEKTASKLVNEFGNIENLIESADQLKGKLKENIINNAKEALLSKQLATIILDTPVDFNEKAFELTAFNQEVLSAIFAKMEFRQLATRLFGNSQVKPISPKPVIKAGVQTSLFDNLEDETEVEPKEQNNVSNTNHKYHLINTDEDITKLKELLKKEKQICFDTETTGLNPITAKVAGIAFATNVHEAYYVPIPENQTTAKDILSQFRTVLEDEAIIKVGQNIKYDISALKKYDIYVKGQLFDTMIAHYILRPDMRHNLNLLSETYLNYSPISFDTMIGGKGKNQKSIWEVDLSVISEYACEDADITLQLKNKFEEMLKEEKVATLFDTVEMPLVHVLADMEFEGVALDVKALGNFSKELEKDILALQDKIHKLAGTLFNIDSPKQMGEILFDHLKIDDKPKKTKTGQYATSEEILTKLVNKHDIIKHILDFRSLRKLKSTYVDALPELVNSETKHIHTSYNQAVAATGRLSSDKPNLQNIPIRTQRGKEVRKAFIPRKNDFTLLSADYSQIELRIIAELSKDENMIGAFNSGKDIHATTAAKIFNVPIDDVNEELRGRAKAVNFGISYGQTAFGLSQNLNISRKEAKEIISNFFMQYPKIQEFMDNSIEFARSHGYVETILGRRRYLRDINSGNAIVRGHAERNAINAPIQGSAADMIKIAMINIHKEMKKSGCFSKMILQVHDELIFDAYLDELDELMNLISDKMKTAIVMQVPVEINMGNGNNWLEAH
ncbi:MAG TPA: DNA polymerase I [Flavobacteriales bacterium]|nr:DNA polymerase I [Flavobacteriales bacterium]